MNLTHLEIENFCCIDRLSVDIENNRLAVFGANGTGKSSIARALQMLLYGRCGWTAKDGKGSAPLVRDGCKTASVQAHIDDWMVSVEIRPSGTKKVEWEIVNTKTGESLDTLDQWWRAAGVNPEHAAVAGMPDAYLLSPDLGDVFADLVCAVIPADAVLAECGQHRDWVREMLPATVTSKKLDMIGADCYDRRRDKKRERDEAQRIVDETGFATEPKDVNGKTRTVEDIPAIERGLDAARKQLQELIGERGAARVALTPEEAAEIQAEIDALGCSKLATARTEAIKTANAAGDVKDNALEARNAAKRDVTAAEQSLAALEANASCPTCKRAYDPEEHATAVAAAQERVRALQSEHAAMDLVYQDSVKAYQGLLALANAARDAHDIAYKASMELMAKLSASKSTRPLADIEAAIADTEAKIARGEKLVSELRKLDAVVANKQRVDDLTAEIERLDWACSAFKDGAIQKKLMASGLDDFTARANAELDRFGYRLGVQVDGKAVAVTMNGRPVTRCSRGQQLLAQFAVAVGFAKTGAPVILDNINDLDTNNRDLLFARLRDLDQAVIVMGAYLAAIDLGDGVTVIKTEGVRQNVLEPANA